MPLFTDHDLSKKNTFGFSAKADLFCKAESTEEAVAFLKEHPALILGGGSNVLFVQERYDRLLQYKNANISVVRETADSVYLQVGASVVWANLVDHTIQQGWGGLENLSLIPGWVGAAPMQNIGAYGVEVKDVIASVSAIDISSGVQVVFDTQACQFGYRESFFKREGKGRYLITDVVFKLDKDHKLQLDYGAIRDELAKLQVNNPTIADVSQAVKNIRRSKLPDPAVTGNAGSFFKNPELPLEQVEQIKSLLPGIPVYTTKSGHAKLPAGYLIEQAGWKGKRFGNVGVHPQQALVLAHYGGGKGQQILDLAKAIQNDVRSKYAVSLTPEVNIV